MIAASSMGCVGLRGGPQEGRLPRSTTSVSGSADEEAGVLDCREAWEQLAHPLAVLALSDSRREADRAVQARAIRCARRGVVALLKANPALVNGSAPLGDMDLRWPFVLDLVDALRDELERLELTNQTPNRDVERLL